ncbi:hypothetical protein RB601_008210 [Gaeumannomyces tritici]
MLSVARHVRTVASVPAGLRLPLRRVRWISTRKASVESGVEAKLNEDDTAGAKDKKENIYIPGTPLAQKLVDAGIYEKRRRVWASEDEKLAKREMSKEERRKLKAAEKEAGVAPKMDKRTKAYKQMVAQAGKDPRTLRIKADSARVNIVSKKLCNDVLAYMAPSLERHKGCDIIDLYPGAGLFSTALSDFLQPRSHILMEPDHVAYTPFLKPLLDRPGTVVVPESGVVWSKLSRILTPEFLPHQVPRPRDAPPERNDTLLVVGNINFSPKKKLGQFSSLGNLLLYQFIHSVASRSLFQKYGLVRMLLWCGVEEKRTLLPRTLQRRKRTAIDGELAAEYIHEIAAYDDGTRRLDGVFCRDHFIDLYTCHKTLQRMRAAGIDTPPGRETELMRTVRAMEDAGTTIPEPGKNPVRILRTHLNELNDIQAGDLRLGSKRETHNRLKELTNRTVWDSRRAEQVHSLLLERDAISKLRTAAAKRRAEREAADVSTKAAKNKQKKELEELDEEDGVLVERELAWNNEVSGLDHLLHDFFRLVRDNLRLVSQDPPVLHWDRRALEPLTVDKSEFFPNVPASLLDIQPKVMHHRLREMGPGSSHAAEEFDLVMSMLLRAGYSQPIEDAMRAIWHGAAEGAMPNCPSLRDPERAGSGLAGLAGKNDALCTRVLNEAQWMELLEAWLKWPFRPSYEQLIGATEPGSDAEED